MTAAEQKVFRHLTGRSIYNPPLGGWFEFLLIVGRQAGKSWITAVMAAFYGVTASKSPDKTDRFIALVAQDSRSTTRVLFGYIKAIFETLQLFMAEVESMTVDTIRLKNGIIIAVYPCRPAALRGIRAILVICDELAFFTSTENFPVDREILRAVRPTLATTGGKLIILSSPYGQSGALWDLHRKHHGRDDSAVLSFKASAPELNPTLPTDYLIRMQEDDPEAYLSEVLGEFRSGLSTFLDPQAIQDCVAVGVLERVPITGIHYHTFCDPSGGRHDRFTLAIAHEENGKAIIDAIRAWMPPFNPSGVVSEVADLLKTFGIYECSGDRYSAEFVAEQFRLNGITCTASDLDRSRLYLELLGPINSQQVELLDHAELLRELRGLERRRGTSGRDRIDHRNGSRDDIANSVAGVVNLAQKQKPVPGCFVF